MAEKPGKVKVFISWSGSLSKVIAHSLKLFLPRVIQSLDPWVSADDISAGTLWHGAIIKSLQEARFGIIVLTNENVGKPWLHYETGYMTHYIQDDRNGLVSPLLIEVPTSSLEGPMTSLQATRFTRADMLKLVNDINALLDEPLSQENLDYSFENAWTTFETEVRSEIAIHDEVAGEPALFDQEKVLTQILDTVVGLARKSGSSDFERDIVRLVRRSRDLRLGDSVAIGRDFVVKDGNKRFGLVEIKHSIESPELIQEDPHDEGDQTGGDQARE